MKTLFEITLIDDSKVYFVYNNIFEFFHRKSNYLNKNQYSIKSITYKRIKQSEIKIYYHKILNSIWSV